MKKVNKTSKILIIIALILTIFRILIQMKIPLFLQADAFYDDYLYVMYAKELMQFNWLGDFSFISLAKGASFSFFILGNYLLGIPYSLGLILTYIFSIIIFILSIKKLIKNKWFLFITYIYLLFSPVMFHAENIQKVYRGGVLLSFALLVISGIIGIYTRINDNNKKQKFFYVILTSISLSFFWFLKEDSIWILPFVLGGLFITIINILKTKDNKKTKRKKIFLVIIPLITLFLSINVYKSINYIKYGEYAVTDRNGTYFKEVISDLLLIEDENSDKNHWITKDMLEKAYNVSPSFSKIKNSMDDKYSFWQDQDGEIVGDIIYWAMKEAANESGIYDNGGKEANNYYKKVHEELQKAFDENKLKKNNEIHLSSVVKGITKEEIPEYLKLMKDSEKVLLTHSEFDIGIYEARGSNDNIALFNELTMSQVVMPNSNKNIYKPSTYFINVSKKIVSLYQKIGYIMYYIFIITLIVFTINVVSNLFKKKINERNLSIYLIMLGLSVTCFAQFFGTTFFCRFLSFRKIYDYTSIIFPIIQILEIISIYLIISNIKKILKKKYL